jgi:hypothetical protein
MEKITKAWAPDISISLVRHLQLALVSQLLNNLTAHCHDSHFLGGIYITNLTGLHAVHWGELDS